MKNLKFLRQTIAVSLVVMLLANCSKEQLAGTNNAGTKNALIKPVDPAPIDPLINGAVKGFVFPADADPVIVIYNDLFFGSRVYPQPNGSFVIEDLPPDVYTVYVTPANRKYQGARIQNVVVTSDNTTVLDPITLQHF